MSTYQSVQSAANDGDSLVITKPTSLAVGDLMLAGIYSSSGTGGAGTVSINTPSGWTQVALQGISGSTDMVACFSKVADSADVAASNFTFTDTNGIATNFMIGHLLRITNYGIVDASNTAETTSGSSEVISTITPDLANCLFVIFAGASDGSASPTVSTYALTTDNPTWTERAETGHTAGSGRRGTLAVATATRSQTTATGDITVTYGATYARLGAIVVALAPRIDGSVTPTTQVYANAFTPVFPVTAVATMDSPTTDVSNPAIWSNQPKNGSTWTPQNKP